MANKPDLADYIEVPERIRSFMAKYPDGSLQGEHKLVQAGDRVFVEYIARAYRTPSDERPGVGTTWEPFPGTTPYTRNSEVENAETSAWGRALAALGFIGKKIATQEEIERRTAEQSQPGQAQSRPAYGEVATERQIAFLASLLKRQKVTQAGVKTLLNGIDYRWQSPDEDVHEAVKRLTGAQASLAIERLKDGPAPAGGSDVPVDASGFEVPPVDEGQVPFFSDSDAA